MMKLNEIAGRVTAKLKSIARSGFSTDIALDMGTSNFRVFVRGAGIKLDEPSVVALNRARSGTPSVTVGKEAQELIGRNPTHISVVSPIKNGVVAEPDLVDNLLKYMIRKATGHNGGHSRVIVGVPADVTGVERRAFMDCVGKVGGKHIFLVKKAILAAIGADLQITQPTGHMIVDIGGGTTEIAVVSKSGPAYSASIKVAGEAFTRAVATHIERTTNVVIGLPTAEHLKCDIGVALLNGSASAKKDVIGTSNGASKKITVSEAEIFEALNEGIGAIAEALREALRRTDPTLVSDIAEHGIMLTGGGALLKKLDKRLEQEVQIKIRVAQDPLSSVVLGAGRLLTDTALLKQIPIEE